MTYWMGQRKKTQVLNCKTDDILRHLNGRVSLCNIAFRQADAYDTAYSGKLTYLKVVKRLIRSSYCLDTLLVPQSQRGNSLADD